MQKKFVCLLLSLFFTATHTGDGKKLIILNDVTENFEISLMDDKIGNYGAITTELSQALLEAEIPVLCTKALYNNLAFLHSLYSDFCHKSIPEIAEKYQAYQETFEAAINFDSKTTARRKALEESVAQAKDSLDNILEDQRRYLIALENKDLPAEEREKEIDEIKKVTEGGMQFAQKTIEDGEAEIETMNQGATTQEVTFLEIIGLVQLNLKTINNILGAMHQSIVLSSSEDLRESVAHAIEQVKLDFFVSIKDDAMRWYSNEILSKIITIILEAYFAYERIDFYRYTSKEVNDDFILFVPDSLPGSYFDLTGLEDFEHHRKVEPRRMSSFELSASLLGALRRVFATDQGDEWNILLAGHGAPQEVVAEIPTMLEPGDESGNDPLFVRFLKFFKNNINTKNLMVISCYPGGKKIETAFDINSEFDNSLLSGLNYTLIFQGAHPTVTHINSLKVFIPPFSGDDVDNLMSTAVTSQGCPITFIQVLPYLSSLLDALDDRDYLKAEKVIDKSDFATDKLSKTMLIKLPNQEWMQPVDFAEDVKKLSQVHALTARKKLVYKENTKILLLSANYVPATIKFAGRPLPMVLPTTHLNYNFYFKNILTTIPKEIAAEKEEESSLEDVDLEVQEGEARDEFSEQSSGQLSDEPSEYSSEEPEVEMPKRKANIDRYIQLAVEAFNPFFTTHLTAEPIYFYIESLDNVDGQSTLVFTGSEEEGIEGSGFIVMYHESRTAAFCSLRGNGKRLDNILQTSYNYEKAQELVARVVERATSGEQFSISEAGVQNVESFLESAQQGAAQADAHDVAELSQSLQAVAE